ncbi:hypothetical protein [Weissella oryzae]|nr:hypothetical protein [Weissella oryzae]
METDAVSGALYRPNQIVADEAQKIGFKTINYHYARDLFPTYEIMDFYIESWFGTVQAGDVVVLQFPDRVYNYEYLPRVIGFLRKIPNVKLIAFIHDVPTYFAKDLDISDENRVKSDFWLEQLRRFDLLIVHNDSMLKRLQHDEVNVKMVSLGLFDFPHNIPMKNKELSKKIYIVSGRPLKKINENVDLLIEIYGSDNEPAKSNISYNGFKTEEELLTQFDGGFGLVSLTGGINLADDWNFYGTLNSPFKLSFYLAAGLPVIVGKDSAQAEYVTQKNIGFAIDSFEELAEKIKHLTADEYVTMLKHVKPIQTALKNGNFTKLALLKAIHMLEVD